MGAKDGSAPQMEAGGLNLAGPEAGQGWGGVVVQGPETFREEICHSFPERHTVYSTWINGRGGQPHTLQSPRPIWRGGSNINLQKTSTLRGLEVLRDAGYEFSWKIRSDFKVDNLELLTKTLLSDMELGHRKIYFLDWVLHKSGYPMDFIQFGRTEDLIDLWNKVDTVWPLGRSPEERLKSAFAKKFARDNQDRNPWKSIGFMASRIDSLHGVEISWLKTGATFTKDWAGNPVFVQSSDAARR